MKNFLLRLLGISLLIPPIVLSPILSLFRKIDNTPWNGGLFSNLIKAYRRYDARSWMRRLIMINRRPETVLEYLKILLNKEEVLPIPIVKVRKVNDLEPQHAVQTDHDHHRARVEAYRNRQEVLSSYGNEIIVVGNKVHDGHHRLAAMREAGVEHVAVCEWKIGG